MGLLNAAVIVAALGYFVDIYDLLLFNIVRVDSLKAIGFEGRELVFGAILHNIQMSGMLIGGIAWGVLGDKRGRLSVLFGSIFIYSVANFLNGWINTFTEYAFLRFFAGFGLAGELGAGVTLVSEILPAKSRGYGTMLVAAIGVMGAIVGGWVAQHYNWRIAYELGGVLGFGLLLLRISVSESGVYKSMNHSGQGIRKGSFIHLFNHRERFSRYAYCILAGIPIWFTIGILVAYAPEFGKALKLSAPVTTAKAVMASYTGFVIGSLAGGFFSQWIKSRVYALKLFVILNALTSVAYLVLLNEVNASTLYEMCVLLGTTSGACWAIIITLAAEQFGTNLRATVATTVPNFIRFSVVPMSLVFLALKGEIGLIPAAVSISVVVSVIAFLASAQIKESFGKDLNYVENL